jgi:hypothetical protein
MGVLEKLGKLLAGFWLGLLGLAILLSFPVCGFIASLAVGAGGRDACRLRNIGSGCFLCCRFLLWPVPVRFRVASRQGRHLRVRRDYLTKAA